MSESTHLLGGGGGGGAPRASEPSAPALPVNVMDRKRVSFGTKLVYGATFSITFAGSMLLTKVANDNDDFGTGLHYYGSLFYFSAIAILASQVFASQAGLLVPLAVFGSLLTSSLWQAMSMGVIFPLSVPMINDAIERAGDSAAEEFAAGAILCYVGMLIWLIVALQHLRAPKGITIRRGQSLYWIAILVALILIVIAEYITWGRDITHTSCAGNSCFRFGTGFGITWTLQAAGTTAVYMMVVFVFGLLFNVEALEYLAMYYAGTMLPTIGLVNYVDGIDNGEFDYLYFGFSSWGTAAIALNMTGVLILIASYYFYCFVTRPNQEEEITPSGATAAWHRMKRSTWLYIVSLVFVIIGVILLAVYANENGLPNALSADYEVLASRNDYHVQSVAFVAIWYISVLTDYVAQTKFLAVAFGLLFATWSDVAGPLHYNYFSLQFMDNMRELYGDDATIYFVGCAFAYVGAMAALMIATSSVSKLPVNQPHVVAGTGVQLRGPLRLISLTFMIIAGICICSSDDIAFSGSYRAACFVAVEQFTLVVIALVYKVIYPARTSEYIVGIAAASTMWVLVFPVQGQSPLYVSSANNQTTAGFVLGWLALLPLIVDLFLLTYLPIVPVPEDETMPLQHGPRPPAYTAQTLAPPPPAYAHTTFGYQATPAHVAAASNEPFVAYGQSMA